MYKVQVPKLPTLMAEAAMTGLMTISANLGASGQALHGVVVDSAFATQKGITAHTVNWTAPTDATGSNRVANEVKAAFNAHLLDGTHAHLSADTTTAQAAQAAATNTATCNALLNELKAKINLHIRRQPEHRQLGPADLVTAADADDDAKNLTLAKDILNVWRRHVYSAAPDYEQTSV